MYKYIWIHLFYDEYIFHFCIKINFESISGLYNCIQKFLLKRKSYYVVWHKLFFKLIY